MLRSNVGMGKIRKRKDGLFETRISTGIDPGTGKLIRRSIYGKTRDEVQKKRVEVLKELNDGVYIEPLKITVAEWMDNWLTLYVENSVKPFTYRAYQGVIDNHIKPLLGAIKLPALTPLSIQNFYYTLQKGSPKKNPLSPKTVKNVHGVLHKALGQAVKLNYIKTNPADACEVPRARRKEITPLDESEVIALLKAISGHPYENLYIVTLFTGMRQGEVLGLTWDCVAFKAGTILVKQQLQKEKKKNGLYQLVPLKNDKPRLLTPASSVMDVLKMQHIKQQESKTSAGSAWDNPLNLVFTNEVGGHLIHNTVYKNFKRIVTELGLPETRFHDAAVIIGLNQNPTNRASI
jgi:integrase